MKKIIFIYLTLTTLLFCQEQDGLSINDTTIQGKPKVAFPSLQLKIEQLSLFYPEKDLLFNPLYNSRSQFLFDVSGENNAVCFINNRLSMSNDFLSPSLNAYRESQRNMGYKYILGVMEGAAVGYLAYEHIRKYGFWDKKKKD
ncbi:MAG: hypothetical protein HYV28_13885 [Ignavibacteriales bacterium]|nr:hypothetical protein [Ignavibacteriales bacterium]